MKLVTAVNIQQFTKLVQEQLDLGAEVLQLTTLNDAFVALTHIRPAPLPAKANVVELTTQRIPEDEWLVYGAKAKTRPNYSDLHHQRHLVGRIIRISDKLCVATLETADGSRHALGFDYLMPAD